MKNKKKTKRNNSKPYSGTYEYYVKYRPAIPKEVVDVIVKHFDIKPTDRVLDLGCGTGQVALAMKGRCGEMVCLDPDPEMLKWAKKTTKGSKIKLTWINCSAENLRKLGKRLGIFKVATCSRAFHRINQDLVLKDLDELIEENGGVAIFGDGVLWGGNQGWQHAIKRVVQKYLGEKSNIGREKPIEPDKRWENILPRSVFRFIKTYEIPIVRSWNVEGIIGYVFSTAAAGHIFSANN